MVRALLDGRKTQTRRIVQNMPAIACPSVCRLVIEGHPFNPSAFVGTPAQGMFSGKDRLAWVAEDWVKNPIGAEELAWLPPKYGVPGDRLWVRETWFCDDYRVQSGPYLEIEGAKEALVYLTDDPVFEAERPQWKPSIHMPRWASRITLELTAVRIEPLNDISEADAKAEGCVFDEWTYPQSFTPGATSYRVLWESINGPNSWALNPWVWVLEFRKL